MSNGDFFVPPSIVGASVASGSTTPVTLAYSTDQEGVLALQVNGSPVSLSTYNSGVDQIVLSGTSGDANGFDIDPETTGPYSLEPGTWNVTAPSFLYNGGTYTPVLSNSSLTMSSGGLLALTVDYVEASSTISITPVFGLSQAVLGGTLVDTPLSAYVDSPNGQPEADAPVTFAVQPAANGAAGSFSNGMSQITVDTNSQGVAATPFTSGTIVGNFQVSASTSEASSAASYNLSTVEPGVVSAASSGLTAGITEAVGEIAGEAAGSVLGAPIIGDTANTAVNNSIQALISNPQAAINQGGEFLVAAISGSNPVLSYACSTSTACEVASANGKQEAAQTLVDTLNGINQAPFVWAFQTAGGVAADLICQAVTLPADPETLDGGAIACAIVANAALSPITGWLGAEVDSALGNETMVQMFQNTENGAIQLAGEGESAVASGWQGFTNGVATSVQENAASVDGVVGSVSNWLTGVVSGAQDIVTNLGDVTATTTSQGLSETLTGGISQPWVASFASSPPASASGLVSAPIYSAVGAGSGSAATSGSVEQCGLSTGSVLAYWSGIQWLQFSSQSESNGCVSAAVSSTTQPDTSQLVASTTSLVGGAPVALGSPTISSLSSGSGPLSGGVEDVITGTNLSSLSSVTTVSFGPNAATVLNDTATQVVVEVPAGMEGAVNVSVNAGGITATESSAYTYLGLVPGSPTAPAAAAADASIVVNWADPIDNGGSPITGYEVFCSVASPPSVSGIPSGVAPGATATTDIVSGLTNGTQYFCVITADNANGSSAPSSVVTATPPGSPGFISANSDTVAVGAPFTFVIRTGGLPIPTLAKSGKSLRRITFHNNRDGTATLSGTPLSSEAGSHGLTFIARFGKGKTKITKTQNFTLTVT